MAVKKLEIIPTIVEGAKLGLKNFVSLLLTIILYVLTVWIPWLNVGTTIGLYRVIIDMTKGKVINPTSIFSKKNYHNLGNFFLLMGIQSIGVSAACIFMFIPGIIMGIAWGFAMYLLIEKEVSPLQALALSDKATYGEKWTIFLIGLVFSVALSIVSGIFALIPKVGGLFVVIISILAAAIYVAIQAVMYRHFADKAEEILTEEAKAMVAKAAKVEEPAPEAPAEA